MMLPVTYSLSSIFCFGCSVLCEYAPVLVPEYKFERLHRSLILYCSIFVMFLLNACKWRDTYGYTTCYAQASAVFQE